MKKNVYFVAFSPHNGELLYYKSLYSKKEAYNYFNEIKEKAKELAKEYYGGSLYMEIWKDYLNMGEIKLLEEINYDKDGNITKGGFLRLEDLSFLKKKKK